MEATLFSLPIWAAPAAVSSFVVGALAIPYITDLTLRYKHRKLQDAWYENLDAFKTRGLKLYYTDEQVAENEAAYAETGEVVLLCPDDKEGRELFAWAQRQVRAVKAQALDRAQVEALRDAQILRPVANGEPDPDLSGAPDADALAADYTFHTGPLGRLGCGALLAIAALICSLCGNPAAAVSGFAALLLMEVMLLTDLKVKLIPIEFTCAFAVCSTVFALTVGSLRDFGLGVAAGIGILIILTIADLISRSLGGHTGVGMGDKRLVPFISILSGLMGTLYGFVAASILAFFFALFVLIFKHGNRKSTVPYAPGLALWCYVGLFTQVTACV